MARKEITEQFISLLLSRDGQGCNNVSQSDLQVAGSRPGVLEGQVHYMHLHAITCHQWGLRSVSGKKYRRAKLPGLSRRRKTPQLSGIFKSFCGISQFSVSSPEFYSIVYFGVWFVICVTIMPATVILWASRDKGDPGECYRLLDAIQVRSWPCFSFARIITSRMQECYRKDLLPHVLVIAIEISSCTRNGNLLKILWSSTFYAIALDQ